MSISEDEFVGVYAQVFGTAQEFANIGTANSNGLPLETEGEPIFLRREEKGFGINVRQL